MKKQKRYAPLIDDYHLLSYEELDSTNSEARRLAEGGAAHGAFIWARRQHQGRGRGGREWISHDGNLFVSILLAPQCQLQRIPQLSFVASLAALESVAPLLPDPSALHCKWPNDLVLGKKKLAGLLLESFEAPAAEEQGEGAQRVRWAVVGLGMNIESCPDALETPATFLKDAGVELVSAKIVLSRFIHHFIECYSLWQNRGFPAIRERWLAHCDGLGKSIKVRLPEGTISGVFRDIDAKGNLLLEMKNGEERLIAAGEVLLP